jgi:hypothetical protein
MLVSAMAGKRGDNFKRQNPLYCNAGQQGNALSLRPALYKVAFSRVLDWEIMATRG